MTEADIRTLFTKLESGFDRERWEHNSKRKNDFLAMEKLASLLPKDKNLILAAEHDRVWFDVSVSQLALLPSPESLIQELLGCQVALQEDDEYRLVSV
jgi:hypothetical protein